MSRVTPPQFRRNRAVATGLLVMMTAIFLATLFVPDPPNWVLFVRAVAEAGMIGGLADWFAVEALFRHPLGIPVPHTALLPKSKDRVARNVGNFIVDQFLKPDLIRQKLQDMNVASLIKDWLIAPNNAAMVAGKVATVLQANLHDTGAGEPPIFFKTMLRNLLLRPRIEMFISRMIRKLMASDLRGEMTDYALISVKGLLNDNRDNITQVVHDRSRWWIASTADRRLSDMMVNEMIGLIDDLLDPNSQMRASFDQALSGFTTDPAQSDSIGRTVQTLLLHLVDHEDFDDLVATFIRGFKRSLEADLEQDHGHTVKFIETTLLSMAHRLDENPDDLAALNIELPQTAGEMVGQLSNLAADFITTTIQTWDEREMVALFEDQVGSDLQYIRMNGTVLGGLIGGALFAVTHLIQG